MTRIVLAFALLALIANAADPTPTTASLTSGSFNAAPASKVIDATTTTAADYATWFLYDSVTFGPATANTTIYAYGFDFSSTAITKVISRALNATLLSNGTAATAVTDAKIGTDGAWAPATVTLTTPISGVGLGSVGIAYTAIDTATVPCAQLFVAVYYGGGSSAGSKQITSNTCTKCTTATSGTTGTGYVITPHNVYYDNGTYWVSYTQTLYTATSDGATASLCAAAPIATATGVVVTNYKTYINGATASATPALAYTASTELYSSTANAPNTFMCGPSNYTNSTNIYCAYKDSTAATANLILLPVTMSSGAKGTAVTIATDSTAGTSGNADYLVKTYTFAGFVYSQYQQGVLINYKSTTGATPTYANQLNFWNTTADAPTQTAGGTIVGTSYTNAIQSSAFTGAGINYVSGYAIFDQYVSSTSGTSTTTYEWGSFLSNGTVNTTKVTIAAVQNAAANYFVDANGAVWFGAYTTDTTSGTVVSATVGKLIAQVYAAGNILASFFALLSVMIATVFAF